MTIASALRRGASLLAGAGIADAARDAELLLMQATGWDRATLIAEPEHEVPFPSESRYLDLVRRRATRVPLQHLTGQQAFWRQDLEVTPDVLIPRPETEILVEAALPLLDEWPEPLVVDVGTGSGCIALAIAAERPSARVHGTDISPAALAVAARNRQRLGLEGRVTFHEGDLLAPVASLAGGVHMVVSNPPYVASADRDTLAPEVRDHEPEAALFPPGDAASVYRRLAPMAADILVPGGWLLLEIGQGMADGVTAIVDAAGFHVHEIKADLQSIPRTVIARRRHGTMDSWPSWNPSS